MGECRVCREPILLEGRCYKCSTGAMDGYEAAVVERDALRAELARAKAESLRVVYLPDDYEFMADYYMTPDGIGWNGNDWHGDSCVETPDGYHKFADCKKIKLERWETSS